MPVFPVSAQLLVLYITYLQRQNFAVSTIYSHVSAIALVHKLRQQPDPSESFLVKKILVAVKKHHVPRPQRLPITDEILHAMIAALPTAVSNAYRLSLFTSMFLVAFHAFLRVGEITTSQHNLAVHDVQIRNSSIHLTFSSFKHAADQSERQIVASLPDARFCPVHALGGYMSHRGQQPGPLYIAKGKPISRKEFVQVFKSAMSAAGIGSEGYNSHSFRIGAATT